MLGHQLDGVNHVADFQEANAAELLLRFSKGTIANDRRAVLPAQRLGFSTRQGAVLFVAALLRIRKTLIEAQGCRSFRAARIDRVLRLVKVSSSNSWAAARLYETAVVAEELR